MADSRFFDGYTWVSDSPRCEAGLCMPTMDRQEAAKMFWRNDARYHNRGKVRVAYTMQSPDDEPMFHEVVL